MPSTSTLSAAGAALGFLAGLALASAPPAPLFGEATPYDVSVEWRSAAPAGVVVARLDGGAASGEGTQRLLVRHVVLPAALPDASDGACPRREAERVRPRRT